MATKVITESGSQYLFDDNGYVSRLSEIPVIDERDYSDMPTPIKEFKVVWSYSPPAVGEKLLMTLEDDEGNRIPLISTPVKEIHIVAVIDSVEIDVFAPHFPSYNKFHRRYSLGENS